MGNVIVALFQKRLHGIPSFSSFPGYDKIKMYLLLVFIEDILAFIITIVIIIIITVEGVVIMIIIIRFILPFFRGGQWSC